MRTAQAPAAGGWTGRLRARTLESVSPERLLPDQQPAYVSSWIYVFGVATIAALIVVIVSGGLLAIGGPTWWHTGALGHFVNSLHLWSVELFFFCMVIHLWGKFFMAAWRGRRALTWVTGAVAFLVSIATAFTGYLVQTNVDSQWIASEAKDGINATGAGAFWNVLDVGQMLLWHVMLLPLAVGVIVVLHVILVRLRGVVPPIGVDDDGHPLPTPSQDGSR
jgi:quinol-cytochrome oxidoreductase complex cytochrome b subunit